MVSKNIVNDKNISAKAKGIMLYLLSKPDDWNFYETEITNNMKDGIDSIRAGIKELISAGYIVRKKRLRDDSGKLRNYEYEVYEEPQINHIGFSKVGKTYVGESNTSNNDLSKNDLTDNKDKEHKTVKQVLPITLHTFSKDDNETVNEATAIVSHYYKVYKQRKGEEHPKLKRDQLDRVYDVIMEHLSDGLDGQLWTDIINQHMERSQRTNSNDLNINAFATETNLSIYFMREGIM